MRSSVLSKGNQEKWRSWEDLLNSGIREDIILAECSKTATHQQTNMSGTDHSLCSTDDTKNLNLIDASYRHVAAAIKLDRSVAMFVKKYKRQGAGPNRK